MSTQAILDVMEQQQQIESHGWQMFKEAYHRKMPPPILEKQAKEKTDFVFYAMIISAIGAFVVGGLQTIPSFYIVLITAKLHWAIASIGGVSGFLAIDVGMFATSYYIIQTRWRTRGQDENSFGSIVKLIRTAQVFGFVVSVATNFYFVFFAYQVNEYIQGSETPVTLFVAILIALAPAIQGWAIGSVIAALPITKEIEALRVERRNRELSNDYEKAMRSSWDRQKSKYGVVDMSERIERLQDEPVNQFMNVHELHETPKPRTKPRQSVHEYLNERPNEADLPIRELAHNIGLSTGLVSEERNNWLNTQ